MNAIELRNLQEQVQKNKDDILKHFQRDEVLADFGIRIIGQVETEEELNAIPTEGLEYGDAYAVGAQSPFNYYIWTRANNINPNDYWFAFGEIAIVGPQGPKGDKGATGATGQSTRWYLVSDAQWSYDATGKKPGDMVLTYPSGNVYMMGENGTFTATGNIRGPQGIAGKNGKDGPQGIPGPQGPKGDTGDVGGFINIAGVLTNEYDLPDPSLINNLTVAYLVGTMEPYSLYIQVGSTSKNAEWLDAGPLNVATMVTVNGQYQNTWNADTKVDKFPSSVAPGNSIIYGRNHLGNSRYYLVDGSGKYPECVPTYNRSSFGTGILKTSEPEADNDCANKGYVDGSHYWIDAGTVSNFDDSFYANMEQGYQYIVSGYIFIKYIQEGRYNKTQLINLSTGTLFVPDKDTVQEANGEVISTAVLTNTDPNHTSSFADVRMSIGGVFVDTNYITIDDKEYVQVPVHLPEPDSLLEFPIEIEEMSVTLTYKKIY